MNKIATASFLKALIDRTSGIYETVNRFDSWSQNKKREYLDESFFNMVNYSYEHVPYYKDLFNTLSINPKHLTSINSVVKIPVLTKDIIRKNYLRLQSDEIKRMKYQDRRSGGTTGEPIRSLVSKEAVAFETYTYFKGLAWMGWKPGMTTVRLFGGSLGVGKGASFRQKVYQASTNSISIPAFEINNNNISQYYDLLRNRKQVCIIGYASTVNILVNLLKDKALTLDNVALVITTSEQLIEDWRYNIEGYFDCPTRSFYGCGEVGSLGYQLFQGNDNYRIPVEHVYIESGSSNELYITQLHNKAQPLIRYENGDLGIISEAEPSVIQNFLGRISDLFVRRDGTFVSPSFGAHAILRSQIPVRQYQYIQYTDDIIEFRYVMESGELTEDHKSSLRKIIDYVMREESQIVFNQSTHFEVGLSMKHRITVKLNEAYSTRLN